MQNAKSLETIDLQCNNLSDKHQQYLAKVICSQYELKDILRWKLGLRNPSKLNINRLGVKSLILSRNNFSDTFAYHLSQALKADDYIKSICLKRNNIGFQGIKYLAEACHIHPSILSIDLRHNPCYKDKKA